LIENFHPQGASDDGLNKKIKKQTFEYVNVFHIYEYHFRKKKKRKNGIVVEKRKGLQ